MKKNEIKSRKLILEKHYNKISDFWYIFANNSADYFKVQFFKHFNKLQKYHIHIWKNCCCSNYNSYFKLDFLNNHYLYKKHSNHFNVRHEKMLELITDWVKNQVFAVFSNLLFQSTVYCFISENQLSQLTKNVHIIINLNELHNVFESWHFFQNHDMKLFRQLQAVYHVTENLSSFSAKINQIQTLSQHDDMLLLSLKNVSAHQVLSKLSWNQACNFSKTKYLKNDINSSRFNLSKIRISLKSCKSYISINEELTESVNSHELSASSFEWVRKATWRFITSWIFLKFLI